MVFLETIVQHERNKFLHRTLFKTFKGFYCVNVQSNVLDFGAEYAGRINAISNTISNSAGFIAPQISGLIFEAKV